MMEPTSRKLTDTEMLVVEARLANEKPSVAAAYLIWLVGGILGIHRMYLGNRDGKGMLFLSLTYVGLIISIPWAVIDLFLIPGLVRDRTEVLRQTLISCYVN